jgi:hypothetical protein
VGATAHGELLPLFYTFLSYIQFVGLLGKGISSPQGRYVHKINSNIHPRVGFEPTTLVFKRLKSVRALHRMTTVVCTERCDCVFECAVMDCTIAAFRERAVPLCSTGPRVWHMHKLELASYRGDIWLQVPCYY